MAVKGATCFRRQLSTYTPNMLKKVDEKPEEERDIEAILGFRDYEGFPMV